MFKRIADDQFIHDFKPTLNHIDSNASWNGSMFETFGPELEYVQKVNAETPERVWTILDVDGRTIVCDGFSHVNRIGYLITAVPCPADTQIEVYHPDEDDLDDE